MGLHKSTRMKIILAIDIVFFVLELVVGYAAHSLALIADALHMLNDIISLLVGLWAIQVATKASSNKYTYGWQRAEILGGLVNSIFLIALCLSIFLEAIQRLLEVPVVSNPKFVLIVGCVGLASNIVGLFLFHDHGHSHGGDEEHGHSHDELDAAENGVSNVPVGNVDGNDILDENAPVSTAVPGFQITGPSESPRNTRKFEPSSFGSQRRSSRARGHSRTGSRGSRGIEQFPIHPREIREHMSILTGIESASTTDDEETAVAEEATERTPLISSSLPINPAAANDASNGSANGRTSHAEHHHARPRANGSGGHGHSHDMNVRGVFLHVLGDALGNIGVISAALIIWLTDSKYRFYADPAISLLITIIILASAIPLCKGASRILLQAVPEDIDVELIKDDIKQLKGIKSCHHLHVWQLAGQKHIASLHVQLDSDISDTKNQEWMALARDIQECLHGFGIHSATIQPEFYVAGENGANGRTLTPPGTANGAVAGGSRPGSVSECLLEEGCGGKNACCAPVEVADEHSHDHDGHDHGHSH